MHLSAIFEFDAHPQAKSGHGVDSLQATRLRMQRGEPIKSN